MFQYIEIYVLAEPVRLRSLVLYNEIDGTVALRIVCFRKVYNAKPNNMVQFCNE